MYKRLVSCHGPGHWWPHVGKPLIESNHLHHMLKMGRKTKCWARTAGLPWTDSKFNVMSHAQCNTMWTLPDIAAYISTWGHDLQKQIRMDIVASINYYYPFLSCLQVTTSHKVWRTIKNANIQKLWNLFQKKFKWPPASMLYDRVQSTML